MQGSVHALTWNIHSYNKNGKNNHQGQQKNDGTPKRPYEHKDLIYDGVLKFQLNTVLLLVKLTN